MAAFIRSRPAVFALLLLCAVALYIGGSHWRAAVPGLAEDDGIVSGKGLGQDADDEMFPSAEEMEALVDDAGVWRGESAREALVQVELGVMSRCPDALFCEAVMDKVLLDGDTREKVNLTVSYIGKPDASEPGGVKCLHGGIECDGNIQQLCVAAHASSSFTGLTSQDDSESDSASTSDTDTLPRRSLPWAFIHSQNYLAPKRIGELAYARECAKAVGLDWEASGVARCVGGGDEGAGREGKRLLRASVERMREAGVTKSCTILIEGQVRCIHDGGWYNCDDGHEISDFVRSIDDAYARLNPGWREERTRRMRGAEDE